MSILALIRTHPKIPSKILFQPIIYKNYEHPINLIKHPPAELKKREDKSTFDDDENFIYTPSNEDL